MAVAPGNLPEFRHQRCVRYRFRYSACNRCAESCPPRALEPGDKGVKLDVIRCSGCGLCAAACPTSAFHLPAFPLSALTKPQEQTLAMACSPSGQDGDVHLPCLGDIDPALLASLALRGFHITLRGAGHCTECANAPHGGERVELLLAAMHELAQAEPVKWTAPVVEGGRTRSGHRADRRQLFRRFTNRAVEQIRSDAEREPIPESAIRAAAHFVPARRQLAERVLERFTSLPGNSLLPLLFGVADIEPAAGHCTGCEACARVCPTGALKAIEEDSHWTLQFHSRQCVGCGVCVEACGSGALALQHRWQPEGETASMLYALRRYRCQSCGRFFVGLEEERCPVCQDDMDSFDAIFG